MCVLLAQTLPAQSTEHEISSTTLYGYAQVAAYSDVEFISPEDVSAEWKERELQAEMAKEDLQTKPEDKRPQIAQGRVNKAVNRVSLLSQPFIKDSTKTVEQVVKETIAALGENVRVRRFERYNLGEGIEKKTDDFAAEVAAQMGEA